LIEVGNPGGLGESDRIDGAIGDRVGFKEEHRELLLGLKNDVVLGLVSVIRAAALLDVQVPD
jgi:hypothetical protein